MGKGERGACICWREFPCIWKNQIGPLYGSGLCQTAPRGVMFWICKAESEFGAKLCLCPPLVSLSDPEQDSTDMMTAASQNLHGKVSAQSWAVLVQQLLLLMAGMAGSPIPGPYWSVCTHSPCLQAGGGWCCPITGRVGSHAAEGRRCCCEAWEPHVEGGRKISALNLSEEGHSWGLLGRHKAT